MEKVPLRFSSHYFQIWRKSDNTFSFDIWGWVHEWLPYYFVYVLKFDYFTGKAILITLFTWNYCINVRNKTIAIWLLRVENFCFRSKQEVVKERPQCEKKKKKEKNILCTIQHLNWHSSLLVSALTFQSSNFLHTACLPLKWQQLSAPRGLHLAGVV